MPIELLNIDTQSLGLSSEQDGEASHREFLKFWERQKINLLITLLIHKG